MFHAQLASEKINKHFVYSLQNREAVFINTLGSAGKIVPPSKRLPSLTEFRDLFKDLCLSQKFKIHHWHMQNTANSEGR